MPKAITLKATVFERYVRFVTNIGLTVGFSPLSLDDRQADFDSELLSLAMPVQKHWASFEQMGLITTYQAGDYRWAEWQQAYFAVTASAELERAAKARQFTNIYGEYGFRQDAFATWAKLFVDESLAEIVGSALAAKLDILPSVIYDSGYTYDVWGKGEKHYNNRTNSKAFKALLSHTFDGVLVPPPSK